MAEKSGFSTWFVVFAIASILFLVVGIALLTIGITTLSAHHNRQKNWTFWLYFGLGIGLIILSLIMFIILWRWHRHNWRHCGPGGWATCKDGSVRPGCSRESVELKQTHTPIALSTGTPETTVVHGHSHPAPIPTVQHMTTSHLHTPVVATPRVDAVVGPHGGVHPAAYASRPVESRTTQAVTSRVVVGRDRGLDVAR